MKKLNVILMALALVMGFAQCNKEQTVVNNNNENNLPELVGTEYSISLNLGGGSNTRAGVHPFEGNTNYAPVYYHTAAQAANGQADKIEVVYKGKWVGSLYCGSSNIPEDLSDYDSASATFSGPITIDDSEIDGSSPLYFYFIGNKTFGNVEGVFTVDISDQTEGLPVISYAASKEPFAAGTTSYTINNGYNLTGSNWLLNQCALVKFTCENIYDQSANGNDNNPQAIYTTERVITIYGMENKVTIDLNNPGGENQFVWTSENDGKIKLNLPSAPAGETEAQAAERIATRYAIVHQGTYAKTDAALDVAFTPKTVTVSGQTYNADPYGFFGTFNLNETIKKNDYCPNGIIDLVWHSGAFSVSASEQVVFSRGNLQYAARGASDPNGTWRFAKHQYDFVGGWLERTSPKIYIGNVVYDEDATSAAGQAQMSDNTEILNKSSYYGWIDLFGWNTGNIPMESTRNNLYYAEPYAYMDGFQSVHGNYYGSVFHDWGANDIINSGTPGNTTWWTSLSKNDAVYLFEDRANASSKVGFGQIVVSETLTINGLIILPDAFTAPDGWVPASSSNHDFNNNVFSTVSAWMEMEAAGAVFLPAAGYRDTDGEGTSANPYVVEFDAGSGDHGVNQDRGNYYWNDRQGPSAAWGLGFGYASGNDLGNHVNANCGLAPNNGRSVRLVHRL